MSDTSTQIEPLIRAAIEHVISQGWTIVSDGQTTVNFKKKQCCAIGACYAVAGEGVETFTILGALDVGFTWAVEFTLAFDGIVPTSVQNEDAYLLGEKLRKELIK